MKPMKAIACALRKSKQKRQDAVLCVQEGHSLDDAIAGLPAGETLEVGPHLGTWVMVRASRGALHYLGNHPGISIIPPSVYTETAQLWRCKIPV